ncbi:MAG: hypothetical protein HY060_18530 [Proteobacteria bacterium]|nr:hypothetical protein [Pseudomonadota bacterium]
MPGIQRGWLIAVGALVALGAADAAAQTGAAPGTGVLTLPPLGTPGTGTGSGTGGAGNSRLGGAVGGVPGMGHVQGPASSGVLQPGNVPGSGSDPIAPRATGSGARGARSVTGEPR